jgi:hypothetical protein
MRRIMASRMVRLTAMIRGRAGNRISRPNRAHSSISHSPAASWRGREAPDHPETPSRNSSRVSMKRNASSPSPLAGHRLGLPPPLPSGRGMRSPSTNVLLPGRTCSVRPRRAAPRRKLGSLHAVERDADLAALQYVVDVTAALQWTRLDGPLQHGVLGSSQKSLAILETFTARVQPPVDDVHVGSCMSIRVCTQLGFGCRTTQYATILRPVVTHNDGDGIHLCVSEELNGFLACCVPNPN